MTVLALLPDIKRPAATGYAKHVVIRKRTVDNLMAALDAAAEAGRNPNTTRASTHGSYAFTGTDSAGAYLTMLRDGWTAGVEGVEGLAGLSTDSADKIMFARDVGGAFPVVPAYLAGAPDAMLMPRIAPSENVRGLTLVIDGSFGHLTGPGTGLEYARSVMRLVAWLQAEQIETAIYVSIAIRKKAGKTRYVYVIPVREAGQVLQPERIAALCHPSLLRRAWFALVEYEHYERGLPGASVCTDNYGVANVATAEDLRIAIPEAYSVVLLPKVGSGDPMRAVQESDTLKLRQEGF